MAGTETDRRENGRGAQTGVERIDLGRIDGDDHLFSASPGWFPFVRLLSSIEQVGIVSPLHLQSVKGGGLRVVMGFRRLRAARKSGLTSVPGLVREGEPLELYREAVLDNVGSRPLHQLEKSWILLKLQSSFGLNEATLIQDYLPLLELRPDRFQLRHHLALARLPETIQRAVYDYLDGELAVRIGRWHKEEQELFLAIASSHRLGRNKQKLLFGLLDDLRALERLSATGPESNKQLLHLWESSGLARLAEDAGVSPSERFERILRRLRELRFPALSRHEERYRELKKALRVPPEVQLNPPAFFEGERLAVSFSCRTVDEFLSLVRRLSEAGKQDELRQIFELL